MKTNRSWGTAPGLLVRRTLLLLGLAVALQTAQAQDPNPAQPVLSVPESEASSPASELAPEVQSAAGPVLPRLTLTATLVYQLLLAEIAIQRDHLDLALHTYTELVRSTQDPRLAQRATEVALYAHQPEAVMAALDQWLKLDPQSLEARQTLSAVLLAQPELPDVQALLSRLLAADAPQVAMDFRNLNLVFMQHPDHAGALKLARALAEPYPQVPEAHYMLGTAAILAEQPELALSEAQKALQLQPGWEPAALLQARVLQIQDPAQANEFYRSFLAQYPHSRDFRLAFARALVEQKDYAAAREQFKAVLSEAPDNADLTFAVALLTLQLKDYEQALPLLQQALDKHFHDPDLVRFYLGQAYEELKDWNQAAHWYEAVGPGDQEIQARIRDALMWSRLQQRTKALDLLQQTPVHTTEQKDLRTLAQEQVLRDAGDYQGAFDLLNEALKEHPDATDLLYEQAIVADKLDRMETLEQDLRRVMVLRPDYAQAYNALGYSLADRHIRLPEALALIQKALALAPQDPFIMDSLGWVQFRMGQVTQALGTLQQAYALQSDPEIAAHLGEVEWTLGDAALARKTWDQALKNDPSNELLNATVKRLAP